MSEKAPFENFSKKVKTITVDGQKIRVKATTRDAEVFLSMSKEMNEKSLNKLSDRMIKVISRAYPDSNKEDIDEWLAQNYGEVLEEFSVLFGFTSKAELNKIKEDAKKAKSRAGKAVVE